MRQIHMVLMSYAGDNNNWFPPVYWGDATTLIADNYGATPSGGWLTSYFPNTSILRCPAMDPKITTDGTYYWGCVGCDKSYWTTYRIVAGTSDHPPHWACFYGWSLYYGSTPTSTMGVPCPNLTFPGRLISGYGDPTDYFGPLYVNTADKQPAVIDAYNRDTGLWGQYGRSGYIDFNNHSKLDGENIVFVDGHGEWRTSAQVQQRWAIYAQWIYW
jgi:hypothetical protein